MKLLELVKALVTLSILDYIYLTSTSGIFKKIIEDVQKSPLKLRPVPTMLVYFFIFTMWYKFIYSVKKMYTLKENVWRGFLLGFFTYGIYELTNYAIFNNWKIHGVIIDTLWGGILYALITVLSLYNFF